MNFVPTSLIISRWYAALSRIHTGTLCFVAPDGERSIFRGSRPGPEAEFVIAHWDVILHLAARGDVALGEDYIAGLWETPAVEPLFALFLQNMDAFGGFADGNRFHRSLLTLYNRVVRRNSRRGSARNIRAHYDVGNQFYSLWLDETMTYSSALATDKAPTLEAAQKNKYGRILSRFEKQNAHVLEVGCGWGGFAQEAAAADHQVTGLTISPSQYEYSRKRLGNQADIRLEDYRDVRGTYDMIVSIEMFEAVGEQYWASYFTQLRDRLKRGGRAIVQTITIQDELFEGYRRRSDFIRHYVFPGGMLPSAHGFKQAAARAGLAITDQFFFGQDYAETLRQWDKRLTARQSEVLALGYDERFLRNWRYYLGMCAAAFAVGRTDVAQFELAHTA